MLDNVLATSRAMVPDRVSLLAASCAARLRPIVHAFGSGGTLAAFDSGVELLWQRTRDDVATVQELLDASEVLVEGSGGDLPPKLVADALRVPASGLVDRTPGLAAGMTVGVVRVIGYHLDDGLGFEHVELDRQLAVIHRLLVADVDTPRLREEAVSAGRGLASVLDEFARRTDSTLSWDVCEALCPPAV